MLGRLLLASSMSWLPSSLTDSDSEAAQLAAGYLEACEDNLNKAKKRKERKKKQKVKLAEDVKVAAEEAVQVLMDSKQ